MEPGLITLMTDYGTTDHYAAALKGVIIQIAPDARIIDITHDLRPFDVLGAAFLIQHAYRTFPPRSIHVAVVDPGVGSDRRPILIHADQHYFIGPDNGLFSFLYRDHPSYRAFVLDMEHYHRQAEGGKTFHGRDIFAPCAAWLWRQADPELIGTEVEDPVSLEIPEPKMTEGKIQGEVLHVDHFGNLITNIPRELLDEVRRSQRARKISLILDDLRIMALVDHYAAAPLDKPAALFGSTGLMEIIIRNQNAAQKLGKTRGARLLVELSS